MSHRERPVTLSRWLVFLLFIAAIACGALLGAGLSG